MNKTWICILAASCAGAAHAQSSVTLYGVIDAGVGYTSGAAGHSLVSVNSGNVAGSRWGMKGVEDLGGGLRAIFTLEGGYSSVNGTLGQGNRLFGRQSFVGLTGDQWGTVTFGRQYDIGTQLVAILAGYPSTGVSATPGDLDGRDGSYRLNNTIEYQSPVFNGVKVAGMYGFGGQPGSLQSQSSWSVGASYVGNPVALGVAYTRMNNGNGSATWNSATTDSTFAYPINQGLASTSAIDVLVSEASYTLGGLTLGLGYSNVRYQANASSVFRNTAKFNAGIASVRYQLTPAAAVLGSYSYTVGSDVTGGTGNSTGGAKYNQFTLGLDYSLSKQTLVYARTGYQRATGHSLAADGKTVIAAPANIGDLTGTSNASPYGKQFTFRVGLLKRF